MSYMVCWSWRHPLVWRRHTDVGLVVVALWLLVCSTHQYYEPTVIKFKICHGQGLSRNSKIPQIWCIVGLTKGQNMHCRMPFFQSHNASSLWYFAVSDKPHSWWNYSIQFNSIQFNLFSIKTTNTFKKHTRWRRCN